MAPAHTLVVAIGGWFAILAGVTAIAEPTNDVIVFGTPVWTLGLLVGTDVRIADLQPSYMIAHGTERGFVRALYANGAGVVLPARNKTCMGKRENST